MTIRAVPWWDIDTRMWIWLDAETNLPITDEQIAKNQDEILAEMREIIMKTTNSSRSEAQTITRTPRTLIDVVKDDVSMLQAKQDDYATGDDPWLNFREAADFLKKTRGIEMTALDGAYYMLGLKISRLKNLGRRDARNEPRTDTLKDLRGYCAIIQAMEEEGR